MTPAETAILDEMRAAIRAAMDRAAARLDELPREPEDDDPEEEAA